MKYYNQMLEIARVIVQDVINVDIQRKTKQWFQRAQYNKDITVMIPCRFIFLW